MLISPGYMNTLLWHAIFVCQLVMSDSSSWVTEVPDVCNPSSRKTHAPGVRAYFSRKPRQNDLADLKSAFTCSAVTSSAPESRRESATCWTCRPDDSLPDGGFVRDIVARSARWSSQNSFPVARCCTSDTQARELTCRSPSATGAILRRCTTSTR